MTAGRPDVAVVRRHLAALDEAVRTLRRHQGLPLEKLTEDLEELWAVERGLQLCAQNALDVAAHLAASGGRVVVDYATAVDSLAAMGVLSREFARRFRGVAGLRNVLVHAYLDVNVETVHRLLNTHLEDFSEFARLVSLYVSGERTESGGAQGH